MIAMHAYNDGEVRRIAHGLKRGEADAIRVASVSMAAKVPAGAILVPVPGSNGHTGVVKQLAEAIARLSNASVIDILTGPVRQSNYARKKAGFDVSVGDIGTRLRSGIVVPSGQIVLIDNVLDTGSTAMAAVDAIGRRLQVLVWARTVRTGFTL